MLLVVLVTFLDLFVIAFNALILVRVLSSWVFPNPEQNGFSRFIFEVTEPILGPIRKLVPAGGLMDLSPLVAFFLLQGLQAGVHYLISKL